MPFATLALERISRGAVENEPQGLVFPRLVKLSRSHFDVGSARIELGPGAKATAEIRTGDPRIIEFLLSPLSRQLQ